MNNLREIFRLTILVQLYRQKEGEVECPDFAFQHSMQAAADAEEGCKSNLMKYLSHDDEWQFILARIKVIPPYIPQLPIGFQGTPLDTRVQ